MMSELATLVEGYQQWLKDNTTVRQLGEAWAEVTTPFLDRHNDHLQFLVRRDGAGYLLTDDGFTVDDLEMSGCSLSTPRRRSLLHLAASGFGVKVADERRLEVHANHNDFARKKHSLVQAMLAVNDLFCLASDTVRSLFIEDVVKWLEEQDVRFTPSVKLTGKTGYDHRFDFALPRSRSQPERLIRAINHPNRAAAESLVLAWVDTRETRPAESRALAMLNDSEHEIRGEVLDALAKYEIMALPWSERERHIEMLRA